MDTDKSLLLDKVNRIDNFISQNKNILPEYNELFELLNESKNILYNHKFIVAVIGSLKAGKSTALNSIIKSDLLKTGAGTVTDSLISIENHQQKKAVVFFKNKDNLLEILNSELKNIHYNKNVTTLTTDEINNINNYISEYKKKKTDLFYKKSFTIKYINTIINSYDNFRYINDSIIFENNNFDNYKEWVGDENKTVFINKINLYYPLKNEFNNNITFVDTPGSDSIYIRHSNELFNFLYHSDIILYVISSRYGVRKADYNLLNKLMSQNPDNRINILINIYIDDFNSLNEVTDTIDKIKYTLSDFLKNIKIFPFSALYSYYKNSINIKPYEFERLKLWNKKNDIINFINNSYYELQKEINCMSGTSPENISTAIVNNKLNIIENHIKFSFELLKSIKNIVFNSKNENQQYLKTITNKFHTLKTSLQGLESELIIDYFNNINKILDINSGTIFRQIKNELYDYQPEKALYYKELNSITDLNNIYQIMYKIILKKHIEIIENLIKNDLYTILTSYKNEISDFFYLKINFINNEINDIFKSIITTFKQGVFNKLNPINFHQDTNKYFTDENFKIPSFNINFTDSKPSINKTLYLNYTYNYSFYNIKNMLNKIRKKNKINTNIILSKKIINDIEADIKNELLIKTKYELTNFKENTKYQYIKKIIEFHKNLLFEYLVKKEQYFKNKLIQYFNIDKNILKNLDLAYIITDDLIQNNQYDTDTQ